MIPNYKRPKFKDYLTNILEKPLTDEDIDMINYVEELELQNFNLREDIMIKKMCLPDKEIKDKTFYDICDMPTYEELKKRIDNAIDRLEALIIFAIKYNPIDHSMKVRDFEGVIEILKGSE